MTRGPLSPGVYWRRRLFVLGLGVALVVLIAGLLRGGSDASSGVDPSGVAEQAAATPSIATTDDSERPGRGTKGKQGKKGRKDAVEASPTPTPLAVPSGPCQEGDIVVEPVVDSPVAGSDVTINLDLRTLTVEACTWRVSSKHVTVTITSGSDEIWASRKCPRTIPVTDVVIRRAVTTRVPVVWNAHRSNLGCPGLSEWAGGGYYHVAAAALGGEPQDLQFELALPQGEVVTASPKPTRQPKPGRASKPTEQSKPGRASKPTEQSKPTRSPQSGGENGGATEPAQPRSG